MKLTIITINLNNRMGLEKTLASVAAQKFKAFEFWVIDGGSTDGSVDLIRSYEQTMVGIDFHWLSEPDSGIYQAMNKGIRLAKGDYLQFLNSGDWLVDERVLEGIVKELSVSDPSNQGAPGILIGNVLDVKARGTIKKKSLPQHVGLFTFYKGTLPHTSAYIRKSLFGRYGLYDEQLKIVSDWKWYLQVIGLQGVQVKFTDIVVSYFDTHGISSTQLDLDQQERRKVLEEVVPSSILADYDRFSFDIVQMQRLKRYPIIYKMVWLVERSLFKLDKWNSFLI
jgi:glycosyltransferase involved in cell wall biosynthesis